MRDQRAAFAVPRVEILPPSARKPIRKTNHDGSRCPAYGEARTSRLTESTERNPVRIIVGNVDRLSRMHATDRRQFAENRASETCSNAYTLHIKMRSHAREARKLVILALRDYGFLILRQTTRVADSRSMSVDVRYCASDMAEALGELAKILPVDPAIKAEPFILS
jgi:hypothetical protein